MLVAPWCGKLVWFTNLTKYLHLSASARQSPHHHPLTLVRSGVAAGWAVCCAATTARRRSTDTGTRRLFRTLRGCCASTSGRRRSAGTPPDEVSERHTPKRPNPNNPVTEGKLPRGSRNTDEDRTANHPSALSVTSFGGSTAAGRALAGARCRDGDLTNWPTWPADRRTHESMTTGRTFPVCQPCWHQKHCSAASFL